MIVEAKQTPVVEVEIAKIVHSTILLRELDEQSILDLMRSIKYCGLLQPIMLTPRDEHFEVIYGNHRLEACRRLCWNEIPAIIKQVSDEDVFILQIVENIQRNNVINPVAEAKGYKLLIGKGQAIHQIAEKIGKSYQYVWSRVKLLESLHPLILDGLAKRKYRKLSISHAEQLSLIKDSNRQLELANAVEDYNISLEELEAAVYADVFSTPSSQTKNSPFKLRKTGNSFFIEEDRICLLTQGTFNILVNNLGRKARAIGRKAGQARRKSILFRSDRTISKEKWLVRCLNEVTGLGKLSLTNSKATLSSPVVTSQRFLQGYLEGLLKLKLAEIYTPTNSKMVFKIEGLNSPHGE